MNAPARSNLRPIAVRHTLVGPCIVALLLLALPAAVEAQFNYTTNNGTITITRYTGPGGSVTIPSTIAGLPLTTIGPTAFNGSGLTTVTIPNSVITIGDSAFASCSSLSSVLFLGNAPSLGADVFDYREYSHSFPPPGYKLHYDPALVYRLSGAGGWGPTFGGLWTALWDPQSQMAYTSANGTITITRYFGPGGHVTIPDTINGLPVTSIGNAFWQCTSLTSVTIPNSVTNIGYSAFYGCSGLTTVTIPNSVTSIGEMAFFQCTNLTSVAIPNSVTNIGGYAFGLCYRLTNVPIGNSVISIGDLAFAECRSLTSVTIPNSVTNIGSGAFNGCSRLTAITVDALNPSYSSLAGLLFNKSQTMLIECPPGKAGQYTIPNGVTSIEASAFAYCPSLSSVTIPNSVTNIGGGAFYGCSGLTTITIPNSVTSIGGSAFQECTSLTSVTIPNSITTIAGYAFRSCTSLTSVTIPNSVTSIGDYAFYLCGRLTSVTIPNSVTTIGYEAFCGCGLTNVAIPDSVTSIGDSAFYDCFGLTSATIGNSVTTIGNYAFLFCGNLTNITIGNSVASIGQEAFFQCYTLRGVYFLGNAPTLGVDVFYYETNATVYYVPGTTGWGPTYGGRPTALWAQAPTIQTPPQTQTAEAGAAVSLWVDASSPLPLFYLWYLNATNFISSSTNSDLELTNVLFSQSGAYTAVISNVLGAITSSPATLQVIAPVERRPVPGVKLTGETGSLLNVDYADSLTPAPNWTTVGSVSLTSTSGYYFDLTLPLPPQRFFRAWQTGTPGVFPSLAMHLVPAITLTGNIGDSVRVDAINQFGPIDAWFTLDTVALTNTSQLYFDTSAWGQPPRLYRLVQLP